MDALQKLIHLADDSRYDLACACSSSNKERRRRKLDGSWLYPVPLAAGGYGIMMKTLLSNACSSDCRYCPLRHEGNVRRCTLLPDEIARLFMDHLSRQWLLGIFLSSGIVGTPDRTMERLTAAAEILRRKYRYRGYIHLKIIPGASEAAITRALQLASAVSLNIETPGARYFRQLSAYKSFDSDIVRPLRFLADQTQPGSPYAGIRCSTQFIVGAADESDRELVRYTAAVYRKLRFERVYFSAFQPGADIPLAPRPESFELVLSNHDRLTREHRLYQADFLLRKYHFDADEMEFGPDGNFDLARDPKLRWAERHPEFFPVRINTADREALLRIPCIGPTYADRIIAERRKAKLSNLLRIGLRGKNARTAIDYIDFC